MFLKQSCLFAILVALSQAKVFLDERFEEPDVLFGAKSWIPTKESVESSFGEQLRHGNWDVQAGELVAPEAGVFYALHKHLPETLSTKTRDIVIQFTARMPEQPTCGGNYIKLLPSNFGEGPFTTESKYVIMFGPEQCSGQQELNIIIQHNGNDFFCKKKVPMGADQLNHLYTLVLKSDGSYEVLVDEATMISGQILEDWDFAEPKMIPDPNAVKPEDWDDRPAIPNPEYISIPEFIPDPKATKPEDWDEAEQGEWQVPQIMNPVLLMTPPMIENPNYTGEWHAPLIENPKYDPEARHIFEDISAVGLDLWHLKGGSTFDNLLVTDNLDFAKKVAEEEWKDDYKAELAEHLAKVKVAEEEAEAQRAKEAAEKAANQSSEEKSGMNAQGTDAKGEINIQENFQAFMEALMKRLESGDYSKMFDMKRAAEEGAETDVWAENPASPQEKSDL